MRTVYDMGQIQWRLSGCYPYEWQLADCVELGEIETETGPIDINIPCSVQKRLLEHGLLPDWNIGLNALQCEWVENRHWIFETDIPDCWLGAGKRIILNCNGLDGIGSIYVNCKEVHKFNNAFISHHIEITEALAQKNNRLRIVFLCPPRWLGQFGYTSQMTQWKPRFNYRWDWTARLVQIGVYDKIEIEVFTGARLKDVDVDTAVDANLSNGTVIVKGIVENGKKSRVRVEVTEGDKAVARESLSADDFNLKGVRITVPSVKLWWPNGMGEQPLYQLAVTVEEGTTVLDRQVRRIGFRNVEWKQCEDAPDSADPFLCVINNKPVFLQGVNWTPIRPNFADVNDNEYRKRLTLYRDLGVNILRVWGGGFLERKYFYETCDELGLMIWQEFPLSSSGVENFPPDDAATIEEINATATDYIKRIKHHPCVILWCGGNELTGSKDQMIPVTRQHPLIRSLETLIKKNDPRRRFLCSSPGGPRFGADQKEYGKGVHWDVHGPWKPEGDVQKKWLSYWTEDDALFRSEVGCPGPSNAELIQRYAGMYKVFPAQTKNELWRRFAWWCEWNQFVAENSRPPKDINEYVQWGQLRQSKALAIAVKACKSRFPRCGGIIIWMGHDSFPCTANTSIIDFDGNPKPAALEIKKLFKSEL